MSDLPLIKSVGPEAVYPLRLLVLRPGGTLADCVFPGDAAATTIHLSAVDEAGMVRGVASFYQAAMPGRDFALPVQLRGMATHPSVRGEGYGKALIVHALYLFSRKGADVMWCNAREVAVSFYINLGFVVEGPPFNIAGIGRHHRMYRKMS